LVAVNHCIANGCQQWILFHISDVTHCTCSFHLSLVKGALSPTELYTFFKEVHAMWVELGEYADLSIHDVVDEIIDMVGCHDWVCILSGLCLHMRQDDAHALVCFTLNCMRACLDAHAAQVQPRRPPLITADDLLSCGMSGIFFSMLSDVKQFYEYNNREVGIGGMWCMSVSRK
jgi:serine/threonine-protein phosphatase 2A regulatory subunit B''